MFNIHGIKIDCLSSNELMERVSGAISGQEKIAVTYITAHNFNLLYKDGELKELVNGFDIVHPDGTGIYCGLKYLYGNIYLKGRFAGSDFYPALVKIALKKNWSFFFFGDTEDVLKKVYENNPGLKIKGTAAGFNFTTPEVLKKINDASPGILIVGMGFPKQETWISGNRQNINAKVIIAVGDGIKVFAGVKVRGHFIFRKLGFEWAVRLFHNPRALWKRYLIGNPLFIYRMIIIKLKSLFGGSL